MIRILYGDAAPVARLEWSVYKGASGVLEDFDRADVFLWFVGAGNKFLVECTTEDGVIKAVIPNWLPVGVYGVKAMWVKDVCYKRCLSEVQKVFAVTDDPSEATPVIGEKCVIKVKSCSATYGYDGLSAYEMAVLEGKTQLSEEEWVAWQTETSGKIEDLQEQINEIISGQATVSLAANPSVVFVGQTNDITLTATTDTEASGIVIKKGSTSIGSGTGFSLVAHDSLNLGSATTQAYSAVFTISGVAKNASRNVTAVYPIRIGSGSSYVEGTAIGTPKTSPAGTYTVTVGADGDYLWFNVPATMSINGASMGGFAFPLEAPTNVTIGGVAYKSYRSSNTLDAGTYTIVLS